MPGSLTEAQYEDDPKDAINKEDSSENIFTQVSISSLYELTDLSAVNLSLAFSNKENITDAESFWDNKYQNINIKSYEISPSVDVEIPGLLWGSSVKTGVDYSNESLNFKAYNDADRDSKKKDSDIKRNTYGFFTRAESYILENLVFSVSLRQEICETESDFEDNNLEDKKFDSPFLFGAGLSYIFAENSKIYFSYNKVYRYPFFDEIAGYTGFFGAADYFQDDLDPEKGHNFEFGFDYNDFRYVNSGVNFFLLLLEDEIAPNASFVNVNMDDTIHYGAETYLTVKPVDIFFYPLQFIIYTVAEFRAGDNKNNSLTLVPAHAFSIIPEVKAL